MKIINSQIFTLIMIFGVATYTNGQAQKLVHFGVKGGINWPGLYEDTGLHGDVNNTRFSHISGMIGISAELSLPAFPVGFESGVYYSQKGKQEKLESVIICGEWGSCGAGIYYNYRTFALDYIEIPLFAKFYLTGATPVRPYFLGGAYMGFRVRSEIIEQQRNNIAETVENREPGYLFGMGSDLYISSLVMNVQLRYSLAHTHAFKHQDGKNELVSVVIGIRL